MTDFVHGKHVPCTIKNNRNTSSLNRHNNFTASFMLIMFHIPLTFNLENNVSRDNDTMHLRYSCKSDMK